MFSDNFSVWHSPVFLSSRWAAPPTMTPHLTNIRWPSSYQKPSRPWGRSSTLCHSAPRACWEWRGGWEEWGRWRRQLCWKSILCCCCRPFTGGLTTLQTEHYSSSSPPPPPLSYLFLPLSFLLQLFLALFLFIYSVSGLPPLPPFYFSSSIQPSSFALHLFPLSPSCPFHPQPSSSSFPPHILLHPPSPLSCFPPLLSGPVSKSSIFLSVFFLSS